MGRARRCQFELSRTCLVLGEFQKKLFLSFVYREDCGGYLLGYPRSVGKRANVLFAITL
jgi:hypothetical protein